MTGNDAKMTAGQAEHQAMAKPHCEHYFAYHCFGGMSVRLCMVCHEPDWDDHRQQLEAAAQAAIAAAPACPCGGMPGTACGDLIVRLRADIVRMEAGALAAIKAESSAVTALEAEVAAADANRDAWCGRAGELLTEVNELRARAGLEA